MDIQRVVIVGYHAAELLEIAAVTTTLETANLYPGQAIYQTRLAAPGGRPVTCGNGLTVQAHEALERVRGPLDTLVVAGGVGCEQAAADRHIVAHVRRLARESRRVASVCTGSAVLAAAGLLDGRRATTHWMWAPIFADRYPEVCFDARPIFIRDGRVITAAGVTSALDLALAFVEEDRGPEVAREVSRHLVTYLQRPGDQAQMSIFTAAPPAGDPVVRQAIELITADLAADLSTPALAAASGVSERHLSRLFARHLGVSPARFVRRVRTEAAAHLLETTALPVAVIAARCGFGTAEALRQAFTSQYGTPPAHYRSARRPLASSP